MSHSLVTTLRRICGQRYGPLFIGIFMVVTFSLFIFVGHSPGDKPKVDSWKWPELLPSSPTFEKQHLDEIMHIPDPQGEARHGVKDNYKWYSDAKLRELAVCMALDNCPKNRDKILIINVWHCHNAFFSDYWGGEGIWCNSVRKSLEAQGYTVLYTYDDWDYVKHIYRQVPDFVKAIIFDDDGQSTRAKPHYRTEKNPDGIPAWKFFKYNYYQTDDGTVIGRPWVVTSEPEWREPGHDFRNFTYIGYALESDTPQNVYPWDERPIRAYVLGKHATFFYPNHAHVAWGFDFFPRALAELRKEFPTFEFVSSFKDERGEDEKQKEGPLPIPDGIRNMHHLNATEFDHEIGQARMLVGVGWPTASPSPYRALARGVPFLSPFKVREGGDPANPYDWTDSQHDSLRLEKAPRVYNVQEFNYEGFVDAIRQAMRTPMEPYIFDRMKQAAFDERLRRWMDTDWRAEAERILWARIAGKETQGNSGIAMFEL